MRPLYDDGASKAQEATRDYVLTLDAPQGQAPLLSVFGGKITTYRRLAEAAIAKLAPLAPWAARAEWTVAGALPGGDFPVDGVEALIAQLGATYPFLSPRLARRLVRTYGTEAFRLLGDARSLTDLGRDFGAGLTEAEVNWLVRNEYALSAQDILWRRTKLGLHMNEEQVRALDDAVAAMLPAQAAAE